MARGLISTAGWDHPMFMGGSNPNVAEYGNHEESTYNNAGGNDGGLILGNPSGGSTVIGEGYTPAKEEQSQSEIDRLAAANPAGPVPKAPPLPGAGVANPAPLPKGGQKFASGLDATGEAQSARKAAEFGAKNPVRRTVVDSTDKNGTPTAGHSEIISDAKPNPFVQKDNPSAYQRGTSSYDPKNPVNPKVNVGQRPSSVLAPQPGVLVPKLDTPVVNNEAMVHTEDTMGLTSSTNSYPATVSNSGLVNIKDREIHNTTPTTQGGSDTLNRAYQENNAVTNDLKNAGMLTHLNTGVDVDGKPVPESAYLEDYHSSMKDAIGRKTAPPAAPIIRKPKATGGIH